MVKAVISDIHANLEALCAVMKDIEARDVDEIICLGDIVGYGPDPEACIDFIMQKANITLMGNHDYALIHDPVGFNPIAAEVIYLTKEIMSPRKKSEGTGNDGTGPHFYSCGHTGEAPKCLLLEHSKDARWKFIEQLPDHYRTNGANRGMLCIHATPLDPVFEYLLPDRFPSAWKPDRVAQQFKEVKGIAFYGHTHHPCAITEDLRCEYPSGCEYSFRLDPSKKYIINAGSVGQPRDGDNRACYCVLDEDALTVTWHRVTYDIQSTVKKSNAMCGEGNWCGARLLAGK